MEKLVHIVKINGMNVNVEDDERLVAWGVEKLKKKTYQVWEWDINSSDFPKTQAVVIGENLYHKDALNLCEKHPNNIIRMILEE